MNHSFNVEIAIKYGANKALLIENIAFWIRKNEANKSKIHFIDNYYWTYNSAPAFGLLFPYMNTKSIQRWLKDLEDDGVLKSDNFHTDKWKKDKWFTIVDSEIMAIYSIAQNEQSKDQNEQSKDQNEQSKDQNDTFFTDINTNLNSFTEEEEEEDFLKIKKDKKEFIKKLTATLPFTPPEKIEEFWFKHGIESVKHYSKIWRKNCAGKSLDDNKGLLYSLLDKNPRYTI